MRTPTEKVFMRSAGEDHTLGGAFDKLLSSIQCNTVELYSQFSIENFKFCYIIRERRERSPPLPKIVLPS